MDAAENDDLFVGFIVGDDAHRVIVNVVKFVRVITKLQLDPNLLIEQEQINVIKQWSHILFAEAVITATRHHNR